MIDESLYSVFSVSLCLCGSILLGGRSIQGGLMSKSHLPFEPLMAPRVKPEKPSPVEPVSWFEVLAPVLEKTSAAVRTGGTAAFAFADIEGVAETERDRKRTGPLEPPEVTAMRERARQE